jgi:hypothetical protein
MAKQKRFIRVNKKDSPDVEAVFTEKEWFIGRRRYGRQMGTLPVKHTHHALSKE